MRLRSHLIALVCAALVPVLGFAAFVSRENARLQLSVTERGMRETARAVARTVDKELETAITTLEALGEAEPLDGGSLASFHELCRRVVRSQGWTSILLFEPDGRALMHTSVPLGAPLPATTNAAAFKAGRRGSAAPPSRTSSMAPGNGRSWRCTSPSRGTEI